MRLRALLPLILLMPAAQLSAQRIRLPRIFTRTRTPERPAPLPPQPNFIKRDMYYKSWNLSVETYPVFSYMQASGVTAGPSTWATLGEGIRLDYRVKPYLSATFDGTYSLFGADTRTAEFGTRFRPVRSEYNVHPFLDTRIGYTRSIDSYGVSVNDLTVSPFPYTDYGTRFSDGIGAVVGVGMDFPLTAAMALTTEMTAVRTRMNLVAYYGSQAPTDGHFMLSQYRLSLGLRYNPGRWVPQVGPGTL